MGCGIDVVKVDVVSEADVVAVCKLLAVQPASIAAIDAPVKIPGNSLCSFLFFNI